MFLVSSCSCLCPDVIKEDVYSRMKMQLEQLQLHLSDQQSILSPTNVCLILEFQLRLQYVGA